MRSSLRVPMPALAVLLALAACHEVSTPTEPGAPPSATPPAGSSASLSGVVRDAGGAPIPGLVVRCQGSQANTATAGAQPGSYVLSRLFPQPSTVEVLQGGVKASTVFAVELKPGANEADFVVARFQGEPATLSGTVRTTSTAPITGLKVWCQGRSAQVAADGSYVLGGIVSGWWGISVARGYEDSLDEETDLAPGMNLRDFNVPF